MEGMVQWAGAPGTAIAGKMISSFQEFPPRQRPSSFNLDDVMRSLTAGGEGK
jgi:arylsulfatase